MSGYFHLIVPLISFMASVIVQILLCRYTRSSLFKSIVSGMIFGLGICVVLELMGCFYFAGLLYDSISYIVLNVIIYFSLNYCYFHFLNLGETARRIRLVREIHESGEEGLALSEILERYNSAEIVNRRLGRLLDKKQIICKEGRYFINNKIMLIISKTIILLKLIILGKKSEFE